MESLKIWLLSVTGAAFLVAAVNSVCPEGAVKRVVQLTGGLVLLVVILQPAAMGNSMDISGVLTEYKIKSEEMTARSETESNQLMEKIIEEKTAAYIVDKAARIGAECDAEVWCEKDENNLPVPAEVKVSGPLTPEQREELALSIEKELGIAEERQWYEGGSCP